MKLKRLFRILIFSNSKMLQITIPNQANIHEIKWKSKPEAFDAKNNYKNCIMCKESDSSAISLINQFLIDVKNMVATFHQNSQSNGWQPTAQDEVWWVTVDYPSDILTIHIESSKNAANQKNYLYNYFKTEVEAQQVCDEIKKLLTKLQKSIDTRYM